MISFTVYNELSGEIVRTGKAPNTSVAEKQARKGYAVILADGSDAAQYVVDGEVIDRPTISMEANISTSINTPINLGHIPSHSVILVNGEPVGVTDGTDLELSFDLDGEYEVAIDLPFPWVPIKTTVKVKP